MESPSINPTGEDLSHPDGVADSSPELEETVPEGNGMADFYEMRNTLFIWVALASTVIFIGIFFAYGLNIALNYLLGAIVGLAYVRMLAKEVETMGAGSNSIGKARLLLLVAVIAIASRIDSLEVLPIFFGFMSYKLALLLYTLRSIIQPSS